MKAKKLSLKLLLCIIGAAFALEFAGCHGGSGATASTEPAGAAGSDTNSAGTNAPATTNASNSADTSAPAASQ